MDKISDSIASVGKSIGDGLALLAAAFAPPAIPQQLQPPQQQQQPSFSGSYNKQPIQSYGQFYRGQQHYPPQSNNNLSEKQYHDL